MLKRKMSFGMPIAAALIAFAVSGCQNFQSGGGTIRDIRGDFCNFYVPGMKSVCTDIRTGNTRPDVPASQMTNWATMPPATFESILNALDDARRALKVQEVEYPYQTMGAGPHVTSQDIDRFRRHLIRLRDETRSRR